MLPAVGEICNLQLASAQMVSRRRTLTVYRDAGFRSALFVYDHRDTDSLEISVQEGEETRGGMSERNGRGKVTASADEAVDNSTARREGRPAASATVAAVPDPEVAAKPTRRRFTTEYKLRIVREAESQREPGAIGALLRREGLYATHLSAWRRERDRGALETLRARRRGRKLDPTHELRQQIAELEADKRRLQERVRQAEAIIAAQKKLSEILGVAATPTATRESA
jgi:transposase-like protein